jgi:hypothetical protein
LEAVDGFSHHGESHLFSVAKWEEKVPSHEIHALAVVELRVEQGVSLENIREVLMS